MPAGSELNEGLGRRFVLWNWKVVLFEKCEFVPVAALKNDLAILNMEESTAPESERITPF